jgi:hypothetical protein
MSWQDKIEVQKGNIGEAIVDRELIKQGWHPYAPAELERPHPFDRLYVRGEEFILVDVKTKPRRRFYPDTGIDLRHYHKYMMASRRMCMPIHLAFVDQFLRKAYWAPLAELEQPHTMPESKWRYPNTYMGIRYWAVPGVFKELCLLTDEEVAALDACSRITDHRQFYTGAPVHSFVIVP